MKFDFSLIEILIDCDLLHDAVVVGDDAGIRVVLEDAFSGDLLKSKTSQL